ncbi:MAG TPA: disulfide bond formation protein B, partial [Gammaproteobacteria bacterium]|nr:disulfide bond formation protein B [Gammaproteobacteria bacterium]
MKIKLLEEYGDTLANFFAVTAVMLVLLLAFLMQFVFHELPCPLCLLQRYGFLAIAFGFLLNFRFGFRPSHYSVILLSCLFTIFVALRQVALHVLPGTGSYGNAILGLHLYTWSLLLATAVLISTSILMGMDFQYRLTLPKTRFWKHVAHGLFAALI